MGKYNLQATDSQQSQSLPYHQLVHPPNHIHQQLNAQTILAMASQSPNQLSLSPSQLHHLQQQQSKNVTFQQYQLHQQQKLQQSVRSQMVSHKSTSHSTSPSSSTQSSTNFGLSSPSPTTADQTNSTAESSQIIQCNEELSTKMQSHIDANENSSLPLVATDSTIENTTNTGSAAISINNNMTIETAENLPTQLSNIDCNDTDSTNEFNKV